MLQQGQLGPRGLHLRTGAIDFLAARALAQQRQRIATLAHRGLGHPGRTACPVHVLHAHGTGTGPDDGLQPLQVTLGPLRIGLGGGQPALRLGDLGRTGTVLQATQILFLHLQLGLRLVGLQLQRACIEHRQRLARLHTIPLFHAHLRHAATALEGQRHLPHIDVAIEDRRLLLRRMQALPAIPAPHCQQGQHHHDQDSFLHAMTPDSAGDVPHATPF